MDGFRALKVGCVAGNPCSIAASRVSVCMHAGALCAGDGVRMIWYMVPVGVIFTVKMVIGKDRDGGRHVLFRQG